MSILNIRNLSISFSCFKYSIFLYRTPYISNILYLINLFPFNWFSFKLIFFLFAIFSSHCSSLADTSRLSFVVHMVKSGSKLMKIINWSQNNSVIFNITNEIIRFQTFVLNHLFRFELKFGHSMIHCI